MIEKQQTELPATPANHEETIKMIADKIEEYHQKNYYNIFPAGRVNPWVYDAVAENIVKPLQEEIEKLKSKGM